MGETGQKRSSKKDKVLRLAEKENVKVTISENGSWMKREDIDSKWLTPKQMYRRLYWQQYIKNKMNKEDV